MSTSVVVTLAKLAGVASRLFGRGGGQALPGVVAERLDPQLARKLAADLPHGVILVTGTNGKTTTTKLIAAGLAAAGERVVTNSTGSNLKRGVVSALIAAADRKGRIRRGTIGLFEVDEASLRHIAPLVQPSHIVVLNLFRDQLDRYGELDTTAAMIGQGIAATRAHLHLNADDPLVASLAKYATDPGAVSFFGVEGLPVEAGSGQTATDSDRCPICHERLVFSRVFYGHIGHYHCPRKDFVRPQPDVAITSVERHDMMGSEFTLSLHGRRSKVSFPLPGTYNMYNELAAAGLLRGAGMEAPAIARVLESAEAAFGRVEQVEVEGRKLYLLLIKNPAGFTQVLETFLQGRPDVSVLFVINDLAADGRDVSWLWDVPLETLATDKPKASVSGIRAADMALRLNYAGIGTERTDDIEEAVKWLVEQTPVGQTAFILPTYTAMLSVRKVLSKVTQMREVL